MYTQLEWLLAWFWGGLPPPWRVFSLNPLHIQGTRVLIEAVNVTVDLVTWDINCGA